MKKYLSLLLALSMALALTACGSTGTDADCIAASGSGVRTVLFSIPQKYMHTPVETVAPEDVKATAELLCAYITDLAKDLAKEGN